MGKAYANRKPKEDRPESDFYPTPEYLVHKLLEIEPSLKNEVILEPACGQGAISKILKQSCKCCFEHDIQLDGVDFLTYRKEFFNENFDTIVTNPPFLYLMISCTRL